MPSFSNQKRGDMDKVELVCVFCKKVDSGDGVWSNPDSYSTYEQKNSSCVQIAATSGFLGFTVISNGMLTAGSKHPDCSPH